MDELPGMLVPGRRLTVGIRASGVGRKLSVGSKEPCLGKVPASLGSAVFIPADCNHICCQLACGTALLWLGQASLIGHM